MVELRLSWCTLLFAVAFLSHSLGIASTEADGKSDRDARNLASNAVTRKRNGRTKKYGNKRQKGTLNVKDPSTVELKEKAAFEKITPTTKSPRKIVACVWWERAVRNLFPKWNGEFIFLKHGGFVNIHELIATHNLTSDDLYLGHLYYGDCCVAGGVFNFPGKQLYFNPEPEDEWICTARPPKERFNMQKHKDKNRYDYLPKNDNIVVAGPHVDSATSVRVHSGVQYFVQMGEQWKLRKLLYDKVRPRNTGEFFMGYIQSHFVQEREINIRRMVEFFYDPLKRNQTQVHMGGKCQGNPRNPHQHKCLPLEAGDSLLKKARVIDPVKGHFMHNDGFLSHFRFAVAFENTKRDGYITEKIFNAFLSGAVPVYAGTREVFDIFNEHAFIFYDMDDPEPALKKIKFLEQHPWQYEKMLRQPILANGMETMRRYLSLTNDIGDGQLKKRILRKLEFDPESN